MSHHEAIHNSDILLWLESILAIHVSDKIKVRSDSNSAIILSVQDADETITIPSINSLWVNGLRNIPYTEWNDMPAPGATSLPSDIINKIDHGYRIDYDIMGLAYWMLSRVEEVGRNDLDHHGRFPAIASHAYEYGYLERPIVDEWFLILKDVAQQLWPDISYTVPQFSVKVSHDVDEPSRYGFRSWPRLLYMIMRETISEKNWRIPFRALRIKFETRKNISRHDPLNSFEWLMDISEKNKLRSAFYFICSTTNKTYDADYSINHPAIRGLMRQIDKRGHEIGLHASYGTYQNSELISAEAAILKNICKQENIQHPVTGGRMHYLRWETPTTLYGWKQAHLQYDTTLGYADHIGFRCGTCHEYPAFDPVKKVMLDLKIRPLIAMEVTVISDQYLAMGTGQAALDKFLSIKKSCKKVNGCFALLWHNSHLYNDNLRNLYKRIIEEQV